jgi:hypothetical protein
MCAATITRTGKLSTLVELNYLLRKLGVGRDAWGRRHQDTTPSIAGRGNINKRGTLINFISFRAQINFVLVCLKAAQKHGEAISTITLLFK